MADPEAAQTTEESGKAAKKSGGLVGQLVTAVVAGAAAFGTVFFLPEETAAEAPVCEMAAAAKKEEAVIEEPSLDEISFVELEPLLISLGQGANARHLKIGLTLETPYGYEEDIKYAQPKLRDAFTGYLRALEMEYLEDPSSMVRLRAQLLRRAEVVLGTETVHGVLITDFLVR